MPTVIAHHNVKDRDHWLTSSKREEVFGTARRDEHPDIRRPAESDACSLPSRTVARTERPG